MKLEDDNGRFWEKIVVACFEGWPGSKYILGRSSKIKSASE
jgi:hypothetical protein